MNLSKRRILIAFVGICLSFSGCANVTPVTESRKTIAYSGNDQTAGILDFNEDGSLRIDESARSRYNSLIKRFGRDTIPPTKEDFGLTSREDGNYDLTLEGAERWKKLKILEDRDRVDRADKIINL